jgi:hypothetical protein
MANRKAFEQTVLQWVTEIDPSGENTALYRQMFDKMSDKDVEEFVKAIERGEDFVSMVYSNLKKSRISIENNLRVAKKLGHDFFERLWLTDNTSGRRYLTPLKYMVLDIPVRRQVQMLTKKMSVPKDNLHIDEMTNQPMDESKGAGISFPELLALYSQGLDSSILEMIKLRGGDEKAYGAMERQIAEQGEVNIEPILEAGTRVKSTETLSVFLKAMHYDNNL